MLTPVAGGINTPHKLEYVYDTPGGLGNATWIVMYLRTPVLTRTVDGIVEGNPGECLIHDPRFPQYLSARDRVSFRNDWIHFQGESVKDLLDTLGLPINRLFRPLSTPFFAATAGAVLWELRRREPFWEDESRGQLLRLLRLLARGLREGYGLGGRIDGAHLGALADLRMRVHEKVERVWNVAQMAREVHLSPGRFAVLYRQYFGVSPLEDLLEERISRACRLLTNSRVSIGDVAVSCGFASLHYFSRQFHKRIGSSPREYQRKSAVADR